jgi:sec-independent protein translocase protein TatB
MFDIAFSELLLIGIVALVVIGPERLPKVARTAGTWLGKLNRYVAQVKQDIDRDMQLEELRKLQQQMKDSAQKYEIMAAETGQELKREVDQVDRVMQAMAVTDGGLSLQEFEKVKQEQAAAAGEGVTPALASTDGGAGQPAPAETRIPAEATPDAESDAPFSSRLDEEVLTDALPAQEPDATEKPAQAV